MKTGGAVATGAALAVGLLGAAAFVLASERKKRSERRRIAVAGCSPHATPEWATWVVKVLAGARLAGRRVQDAAGLRIVTLEDAELCEATMVSSPGKLGRLVGWKCGATNAAAQKFLGIDEAFKSPLFGAFTHWHVRTGAPPMPLQDSELQARTAEAEFAFVMGRNLPPRPKTAGSDELLPYTEEEVWEAVETVCPALEMVASRVGSDAMTAATIIADGGINAVTVAGAPLSRGSYHNGNGAAAMAGERARILVNGEVRKEATGAEVMGSPLTSLTWLANRLCSSPSPPLARGLRKGQLVISGAAVACPIQPGDVVRAEFDALGAVEAVLQ